MPAWQHRRVVDEAQSTENNELDDDRPWGLDEVVLPSTANVELTEHEELGVGESFDSLDENDTGDPYDDSNADIALEMQLDLGAAVSDVDDGTVDLGDDVIDMPNEAGSALTDLDTPDAEEDASLRPPDAAPVEDDTDGPTEEATLPDLSERSPSRIQPKSAHASACHVAW